MKTCFHRSAIAATAILFGILHSAAVSGDEVFFRVPANLLKVTSGELPKLDPNNPPPAYFNLGPGREYRVPYAVLDGAGEVYPEYANDNFYYTPPSVDALCFRVPANIAEVKGALFVLHTERPEMVKVTFSAPAKGEASDRDAFYRAKKKHYDRLVQRRLPGGSWFRYQARTAEAALAGKSGPEFDAQAGQNPERNINIYEFDDTFAVFSGGRAISENLQLDRLLPASNPEQPTIDISTLAGITVAEMDWSALTKDLNPQTDPLAAAIPSDQHALFFPAFPALLKMMDEGEVNGTPILHTAKPRSESARTRERYEKQLCLSATAVSRILGDQVIASVAFTGSDPYLPTGTDVAVLFEAKNAAVLQAHMATQQAAAIKADESCKLVEGTVGTVKYSGALTPDRSVSSYVAQVGNSVVVTNSLYQLKRIVDTAAEPSQSIGSLPEYKFFRNRYPRDKGETAFLVVTDQAIRRWCSPKWRIATSRRTRAVAVMSHLQAEYSKSLVEGTVEPHPVTTVLQVPDLGQLRLSKRGVESSTYGTLEFQTPIAELELTKVTQTEAQVYERWREGYQRNWSQFFDPIAVSFTVAQERLLADVTVMPLIDSSEYRRFIDIASGVELKPTSGDPHAVSLMHWAMAINVKADQLKWANGFLEGPTRVSMLGWLGESIAVYADPDPFWAELAAAMKAGEKLIAPGRSASSDFMEKNLHRLPVALTAEVKDPLKLALFLGGLRTFIEQAAPGLVVWSTLEHNGHPYVKITPTDSGRNAAPFASKLAIHYAATADQLVLTLNENLLKRALERRPPGARKSEETGETEPPAESVKVETQQTPTEPPRPWLGKSMALQIDRRAIETFDRVFGHEQYLVMMQALAWSNIAILNEWKRQYPDRDPVAVHQQLWQSALVCPGGGKYVWNDEFRTMESTEFGHPGMPKGKAALPKALQNARWLDFGLTFENRGLRAVVEINRATPK